MDRRERMYNDEIVEEEVVVDESEAYEELVEVDVADEVLIETGDEINDEDMDYEENMPGSGYQYIIPSGVSQSSHAGAMYAQQSRSQSGPAQQQISSFLQRNRSQFPSFTYMLKGNQVYQVEKATGEATPLRMVSQSQQRTSPPQSRRAQDVMPSLNRPYVSNTTSMQSKNSQMIRQQHHPAANASYTPKEEQRTRFFHPYQASKVVEKKSLGIGSKKPCNCTKSMCLKLYCECFANGEFCRNCNCKDCHNNLEHEHERSRAVRSSLERNPNAFKPKIGVAPKGRVEVERLHQKGCHCKKSYCLKNYCECFEAKVACTERCKCVSCRNTESDRAAKFPAKLVPQVDFLSSRRETKDDRSSSSSSDDESVHESAKIRDSRCLPWNYLTDEVIEAATLCMVSQAEELESRGKSDEAIEYAILREFGRCFTGIINASSNFASKSSI